ncbi:MAG: DUF2188 domain-containing protein [Ignavibacteria bacterium]
MRKNQHVVPTSKRWAVKGEGNSRNTFVTKTKEEAISKARRIAKNQKTELVIHSSKGLIVDKDSYGNDPMPPRDKRH